MGHPGTKFRMALRPPQESEKKAGGRLPENSSYTRFDYSSGGQELLHFELQGVKSAFHLAAGQAAAGESSQPRVSWSG